MKREDVLAKAISLLQSGHHKELVKHCQMNLKSDPINAELWKLLGIAFGSLGNPKKARSSFLKALEVGLKDELTLANYITACFHDQDLPSASEAIDLFYGGLDDTGKSVVLDSIKEAIKDGVIEKDNVPPSIKKLLTVDPTDEISGQIIYKEVKEVNSGHGYLVYHSSPRDMFSSAVAFIDGYGFKKNKKTVVHILDAEGPAWNFYEGGYAKTRPMLQEAIELLAETSRGEFLRLKPAPLRHGFILLGGF